ncbi:hypothetical protein ACFQL1_14945 [Halomicroarcula sp. GCM10025709]|uniref:hypothetical protein n=1 Tax=Haloarcula TaxID=2237 RepID=UPI0024C3549C|nr:hypothetical protein [Halomicroarcula sp. YJ-61-S]
MPNDTLTGQKAHRRFAEQFTSNASLTGTCPVCGTEIDAVESDPRRTAAPCGHALADYSLSSMTTDTDSDAHRIMTDGGTPKTEPVTVVFQTYEDDADLEHDDEGQITNHDELVDAGQTYREIRVLKRHTAEKFDMEIVDEDHQLWCDAVASLEPGEALRVDDLREDDR